MRTPRPGKSLQDTPTPAKSELCPDAWPLGADCKAFPILSFPSPKFLSDKQVTQLSQLQGLVPILLLSDLFSMCFAMVFQGNLITGRKGTALLGKQL